MKAFSSPTADKSTWVRGTWNAYVAMGESKEERKARLAEVPEEIREDVEKHVRAVFSLRK